MGGRRWGVEIRAAGLVNFVPGEAEGQVGADGEVLGVLEEALSQPQWTARVHMRWRAEVSRLMVPVAAPAARRAS